MKHVTLNPCSRVCDDGFAFLLKDGRVAVVEHDAVAAIVSALRWRSLPWDEAAVIAGGDDALAELRDAELIIDADAYALSPAELAAMFLPPELVAGVSTAYVKGALELRAPFLLDREGTSIIVAPPGTAADDVDGDAAVLLSEGWVVGERRAAVELCADKARFKDTLRALSLPCPAGDPVALDRIGELAAQCDGVKEWVVKPVDGGCGVGVTVGLRSIDDVRRAAEAARAAEALAGRALTHVLVEERVAGDCVRAYVVDGELAATVLRVPAAITGDGSSTIAELVAKENAVRDARRSTTRGYPLYDIVMDHPVQQRLARDGLREGSVLPVGLVLQLDWVVNVDRGAGFRDLGERVHPGHRDVLVAAGRACGLVLVGLDYMCADITRSPTESPGWVLEANAQPGLLSTTGEDGDAPNRLGARVVAGLLRARAAGRLAPWREAMKTNGMV